MGNRNLGLASIQISWKIDQWFPELDAQKLGQLKGFHDELIKWNKTIPLISVKSIQFADALHFSDSILACQIIYSHKKPDEIYDFGSGNGFPGLVYAILYPQTKVKLVELDPRKSEFLRNTSELLKCTNVEILTRGVETLPEKSIRFAMSRGLAAITKTLHMSRKCFATGGFYYHLKGEEWASEVAAIPTQLCSYWRPGLTGEYKLQVGSMKFAVVHTEKVQN